MTANYRFTVIYHGRHELPTLYCDLNAATALVAQQAIEYGRGDPCWIERVVPAGWQSVEA